MPFSENDLTIEVRAVISARVDAGLPSPKNWIVQQLVLSHSDIWGGDTDFYRVCAFGHVGSAVRHALNDYKLEEATATRADTLPGLEYVQRAYLVTRQGESVVVPIAQLTDAEIETKVDELRRMSRGCLAHAIELLTFKDKRGLAAA